MNNQEYNTANKINKYSGYSKSIAGGVLVASLLQGNNVSAGIFAGLYLVGDITNRFSQRRLNNHFRSSLEDTLEK